MSTPITLKARFRNLRRILLRFALFAFIGLIIWYFGAVIITGNFKLMPSRESIAHWGNIVEFTGGTLMVMIAASLVGALLTPIYPPVIEWLCVKLTGQPDYNRLRESPTGRAGMILIPAVLVLPLVWLIAWSVIDLGRELRDLRWLPPVLLWATAIAITTLIAVIVGRWILRGES